MGATLSNLTEGAYANGGGGEAGPGLGDIPESCVACVFMHLTPPEICNLARLNRAFRGAASADSVWESKLPDNYHALLRKLPADHPALAADPPWSKKNIFALLSRSVPFDDASKEVWLDKLTGGVCMSISAKGMTITGIDDRRYWSWIPTEDSRFHVVAYLQQIWWFEADGMVKFRFPAGVYCASFRLHLGRFSKRMGRRFCSFEHTHGWEIKPVRFELSTSDSQQASLECWLENADKDDTSGISQRGKWIEYEVGEFIVMDSDRETEIRFSIKQIDCTHSKGGVCVDSFTVIPVALRDRGKGKHV